MLPFPHVNFGRGDPGNPIRLGSGRHLPADSNQLALPTGAGPSDMIVATTAGGSVNGGAGWLSSGLIRYRPLRGEDLSPGALTITGYTVWAVYRGFAKIELRRQGSSTGAIPLAGFTKARNSAGLLAAAYTQAPIGSAPGADAPFAMVGTAHENASQAVMLADVLKRSDYVDGAPLMLAGSTGFGSVTSGYVYEMLF